VKHPSFFTWLKRFFGIFTALKVVIPLLILTALVTIFGSLFPEPQVFQSWWYLGLLGLIGFCLLCITIEHIPAILNKKGRNALIGVVTIHAGVIIILAGIIYGGLVGFRYNFRIIEDEMTVVPELPFVIQLDKLTVEEYSREDFGQRNLAMLPKKKQESEISLYKNGVLWHETVTWPGHPVKADGITLLPSMTEIGWTFDLIVTNPHGVENVIPVKPWSPPRIKLRQTYVMAHSLMGREEKTVQVFTIEDGQQKSLGLIRQEQPLQLDDFTIAIGAIKRYTGFKAYHRPQMPVLFMGCMVTLAGLLWHFYHRNRTRSWKQDMGTSNA
jgi:hypothetical protein